MLRRILVSGLTAGVVAGISVSIIQKARVLPLIYAAEVYETASKGGVSAEAGLLRVAGTVSANVLVGVGFGLLLTAAFAIYGQNMNTRRGLCWGLASFAVFFLAPSLSLQPTVPGMAAGEIGPRQVWWLFTTMATMAGLGAIVFSARVWLRAIGALLIVVPHIIAPPSPHGVDVVPPELVAKFGASSLATAALFCVVLGATAGFIYGRMQRTTAENGHA